jgi:hypothetical protein
MMLEWKNGKTTQESIALDEKLYKSLHSPLHAELVWLVTDDGVQIVIVLMG